MPKKSKPKKKKSVQTAEEEEKEIEFVKKKVAMKKKSSKKPKKKKHEEKKHEEEDIEMEEEEFEDDIEEDEEVEKSLEEIYKNKDGSMPDMKKFAKSKKSMLTAVLVFFVSLLALIAAVWAIVVFVLPKSGFQKEGVILSVVGEDDAVIGQEVTYRIRYGNSQKAPLARAVLKVRYPDGFVFGEASQEPTGDNDTWELGSLNQLDSGFIDITGRMYGDNDESQSFRVFLNYFPGNFSSEFQSVATKQVRTVGTPFDIAIEGPDEVPIGINTGFTVSIKKDQEAQLELPSLALVVEETEGFQKSDSTQESDEYEDLTWTIENLEGAFDLTLNGSFSDQGEREKKIVAKLVGWKDGNREGEGYVFATAQHELKLTNTDVGLDVVVNGARGDLAASPGDMLSTSIVVKNTGEESVENAQIKITFEAPSYNNKSILQWSQLDDKYNGDIVGEQVDAQTRKGVITWKPYHILGLSSLDPGDSVTIDIHLPVKSSEEIDLTGFSTYSGKMYVDLRYMSSDEETIISGNTINLTFNSDLDLDVRDSVSENDNGGEVHTITWFLTNSFHEIKDMQLSADIYGDISFDEDDMVVPAGQASFDKENKKLTWNIDSMPTSVDVLALQFDVILNSKNPTQENLMSKVVLKAKDNISGSDMYLLGDEVLLNTED